MADNSVFDGITNETLVKIIKGVTFKVASNFKNKTKLAKAISRPFDGELEYKQKGDTLEIVKDGVFKTYDGLVSKREDAQTIQDDSVFAKIKGKHTLIKVNSVEEILKLPANGFKTKGQSVAIDALVRDVESDGFTILTESASNVLGGGSNPFNEKYMNAASASLNERSVYEEDRFLFINPVGNSQAIESMKDMFTPNTKYQDGKMVNAYGIAPVMSNFVVLHTVGQAANDTIVVDRVEEITTGSINTKRVYVTGLTNKFTIGDHVYFDGIYEFNPISQKELSGVKTFSVVNQATDNSYIEFSEEIKFNVPLQNVARAPVKGDSLKVVGAAGERSYENLLIQKDCVAAIFVKDNTFKPGVVSYTVSDKDSGISITCVLYHDPDKNETYFKIMTMYSYVIIRQEGVVVIRSSVNSILNDAPKAETKSAAKSTTK